MSIEKGIYKLEQLRYDNSSFDDDEISIYGIHGYYKHISDVEVLDISGDIVTFFHFNRQCIKKINTKNSNMRLVKK